MTYPGAVKAVAGVAKGVGSESAWPLGLNTELKTSFCLFAARPVRAMPTWIKFVNTSCVVVVVVRVRCLSVLASAFTWVGVGLPDECHVCSVTKEK